MATKPIAHFNFRRRLYMFKITKEYDMNYRRLVYRQEEYGFDSIPLKNSDYYILFDTLQLGFDSENNACVQIFGFFPQIVQAEERDVLIPNSNKGSIILLLDECQLDLGDSIRFVQSDSWVSYYSPSKGYTYFGKEKLSDSVEYVEFYPDCIAALNEKGDIEAFWLKVNFEE